MPRQQPWSYGGLGVKSPFQWETESALLRVTETDNSGEADARQFAQNRYSVIARPPREGDGCLGAWSRPRHFVRSNKTCSEENSRTKMPRWLSFSLINIALFAVWGFVSTLIAREVAPLTAQVLSTFGLLPGVPILGFSPNLRRGTNFGAGIVLATITGVPGGRGNVA